MAEQPAFPRTKGWLYTLNSLTGALVKIESVDQASGRCRELSAEWWIIYVSKRLDDGSTFDTSMHRDPLEFTLGDGELIPGFEKAMLRINRCDTKAATIQAEQVHGAHRPETVIEVDRQHLPPTLQPYIGRRLQMTQQDGTPVPVLVIAVTDAQVRLDDNHPLVGKELIPPQPCKQPQRPHPTPSRGACLAPAKASLQRAPPSSGALRRAAAAGGVKMGV